MALHSRSTALNRAGRTFAEIASSEGVSKHRGIAGWSIWLFWRRVLRVMCLRVLNQLA